MGDKKEVKKPSMKGTSIISSSAVNIVYIWKMDSTFLLYIANHSRPSLFPHSVSMINVFMTFSLSFLHTPWLAYVKLALLSY